MINSILDNDLYKLTMQQAVCQKFPHAIVKYEFINRGRHKFTEEMLKSIQSNVNKLSKSFLTPAEGYFLERTCPFLNPVYLAFLRGYRFDPLEVELDLIGDDLKVVIVGPWFSAIMWEVVLMAIISGVYHVSSSNFNEDYDFYSEEANTLKKGRRLQEAGVKFADFGTRRRFTAPHHSNIVKYLKKSSGSSFVGTSNLYFAKLYNLKPIGTQAHEWFMFHGAVYGYKEANKKALENWVDIYQGDLGIALSDTFTTDAFFKSFGTKFAKLFDGIRHDSGDPLQFADTVISHYDNLGIDPSTKTIVFSDGLDVDKAIEINDEYKRHIRCSFGIGTHLTCDVYGVEPLNIVIKMTACKPYRDSRWTSTIKLSDSPGKHTGDKDEIDKCWKEIL